MKIRNFTVALAIAAFAIGAQAEDTLAKIKREGVIKWGADPSGGAPFVYNDSKDPDKIVGFEVDIMEKLAAHLGVKQEIVQNKWESLIPNLLSKRCDIVINGVEINEERKKVVAFSDPYYVYEQQLTVRAADKDKYKSLDDLKGHKVGTLSGAESNNVLKRAGFSDEQTVPHDDSYTPYKNLELRRVDAVMQESIIAAFYVGKDAKFFNIAKTFSPGKYAVTLRPADETLLAEINKIIKLMKENGELAFIFKKWDIMNDTQKEIGVVAK